MIRSNPILVAPLFRELDGHLLDLLRSLGPDDWHRPTVCSAWMVRDIAAHLLDTALRRLTVDRDGYAPPDGPAGFGSDAELLAFLHRLNAEWTVAARRISPRSLIGLLEVVGAELCDLIEATDPFAPATFPVGWAGESASLAWFDVAREFTERWHHQRQIARAVDRPTPIDARHLYHPVLDTFLRALPFAYSDVAAPEGSTVTVEVVGDAGGSWSILREADAWSPIDAAPDRATATVTIAEADAWLLFTKRIDRATAHAWFPTIRVAGDVALGEHALELVAIMA